MRILSMLRYMSLSGIFLPFKIYCCAGLKIRSGASVRMKGRLTIGSADKNAAIVSRVPANLYFGADSDIDLGHSISIGPGVNIIVKDKGKLSIGDGTYFTSDSHIEAVRSISIGKNCAISWGVTIIDDDHHEVIIPGRTQTKSTVSIGDKVWIGCNVTILKNTVIGNNCVVAAGSIVKGTFPDNCIIGGNPAKIVKENTDWK